MSRYRLFHLRTLPQAAIAIAACGSALAQTGDPLAGAALYVQKVNIPGSGEFNCEDCHATVPLFRIFFESRGIDEAGVQGIHSATRYLKTFPTGADNAAWADAYKGRYGDYPTNWSWENSLAMSFLVAAMKKTGSTDATRLAAALRGMKIKSPFGADGTVTMRAEDQTTIGYALGWGTTVPKEPYVPIVTPGDWKSILEHEAEWKKKMGYA